MNGSRIALGVTAAAGLALGLSGAALAQTADSKPAAEPTSRAVQIASISPERATLLKMQRRTSLKVEDTRLEDVVKFLQDVTQADIEPIWAGDNSTGTGLDKDKKITINVQNQPALYILEAVLEKARNDFAENTWQMSSLGSIQIGPKEALNKYKRVVIYDINDLLLIIPRYTDVPQIDLNTVLQSNQGGGGGQSPFNNANGNNSPLDNQMVRDDRAKKIMDLITSLVEQPQWVDNGGEGATMHLFNGTLIVNAPDYIHRQINGYPYWPSTTTRVASKGGGRYVTLNMDTGISTIKQIRNVPVTATVGGGGGGGGRPGGGP